MTDLFSAYAEQAIPKTVQRKDVRKRDREAERLQKQQNEDAILAKAARAIDKAWREKTITESEDPAALQSILDQFRRSGPDDGERMVETVRQAAAIFKGPDQRRLLLQGVDKASQRIRRKLGLEPLDDPLPPEMNVFLECREILR